MRALAWVRANEPVRLLVYPVLVALVGYLVVRGTIDADMAQIVTAAIALVLGVPFAEAARARVTPNTKVPAAATAAARTALDELERLAAQRLGPAGLDILNQVRNQIGLPARDDTSPRHRGA